MTSIRYNSLNMTVLRACDPTMPVPLSQMLVIADSMTRMAIGALNPLLAPHRELHDTAHFDDRPIEEIFAGDVFHQPFGGLSVVVINARGGCLCINQYLQQMWISYDELMNKGDVAEDEKFTKLSREEVLQKIEEGK